MAGALGLVVVCVVWKEGWHVRYVCCVVCGWEDWDAGFCIF